MPQLDSLGLRENPFKNNTDPRFFYADQNRAQILESTEHLIEYSSNLQVIIGATGLGKSHLLETLASRTDNNWRMATINDAEQYDTLSLIQAILNSFGVTADTDMDLLESLETQLAEIIQLGFKPVLFIDDAQSLSPDAIRFLLQLSQQKQNDDPYINIVLFATMEITEQLQSPELQDFRDVIHIATLSNLNKEGVSGYLRHKLAVAGFDRESPFTPRIVDSIFSDSNGVPEKINFFANKFLVSSGKAEDYIEEQESPLIDDVLEQEDGFIAKLKDDELDNDRADLAEQQIHRLAEQFDEIESMTEQAQGEQYMDEEYTDSGSIEDDFPGQPEKRSNIAKIIIPVAIVGVVIVAVVVMNTVFKDSSDPQPQQSQNKQIELLPLELPAEESFSTKDLTESAEPADGSQIMSDSSGQEISPQEVETKADEAAPLASEAQVPENTVLAFPPAKPEEPATATDLPKADNKAIALIEAEPAPSGKAILTPDSISIEALEQKTTLPEPVLKMVQPEPVIGSNKRQTISIIGNNLEQNTTLVVSWGDNTKDFSAAQTPEQWRYVNNNKINLHLATGTESRTWQVYAKNGAGQKSNPLTFEVVRPFIAEMAIKSILPDPVIGSDKRQTITIKGQGFSRQTVIELKWDKNSKHFSSRLSPNQFEFISTNEIKLYITTGFKARKWRVIAKKPDTATTSSASFSVLKEAAQVTNRATSTLKDKGWIIQQPDTHYTIQLFGSFNKQAINDLVSKYKLTGDMSWFETQRKGQKWYSMIYGNYDSKAAATKAVDSLDAKLSNPKPWIRSFGSIKEQIKTVSSSVTDRDDVRLNTQSGTRNESWIWTQNPADYTIQLLALSSEKGVQEYVKKHRLNSESVYFKITRNNKPLYVLLYGHFPNKQAAQQAGERLASKLKSSKPWVRSFSEIHGLMNP